MTTDVATSPELTQEELAGQFLAALGATETESELDDDVDKNYKKNSLQRNKRLSGLVDKELEAKVQQGELPAKDLISLKGQLNKEINGLDDSGGKLDLIRLIPMNATINIQNNYS